MRLSSCRWQHRRVMRTFVRRRCLLSLLIVCLCLLLFLAFRPRPEGIPIFVVEEHHEVLPYWFQAAEDGLIPKTGNTLIHIDGHSDEGLPSYSEMPFFQWPPTDGAIENMMQKNDIFIQAAVMTGLISRVIFIWPSWDLSETDRAAMVTYDMEIGWLQSNQSELSYCACMTSRLNGLRECMNDQDEWKDGSFCNVVTRYVSEHVADYNALYKLMREPAGDWPDMDGSSGGVLLDIDEDYFGCEFGSTPLLEVGVDWKAVDELSQLLEPLFCPTRIEHESWCNAMLHAVISAVVSSCHQMTVAGHCKLSQSDVLSIMTPVVKWYLQKYSSLACKVESADELWRRVAAVLARLRRVDLEAIVDLGFCLRTSPATFGGDRGATRIDLCVGANTPNNTLVFAHTPSRAEVASRMSDLAVMLERLDAGADTRADVVTLCRSVRDGYTPRRLFTDIESGILDIFARKLSSGAIYDVFYDKNLLGGRLGWPNRHSVVSP